MSDPPSAMSDPPPAMSDPPPTQLDGPPKIHTSTSSHPLSNRSQVHIDPSSLPPGLSKSAAKKLAKQQYYQETKLDRRKAEKERKKQKKRLQWQQQQQQQQQQQSQNGEQTSDATSIGKRKRHPSPSDQSKSRPPKRPFGAKLVIDLGFDDLMSEREVASLAQQLMYLYSSNKTSSHPFSQLILAGRGPLPGSSYLAHPTPQPHVQVDPNGSSEPPSSGPTMFDSPLGIFMEQKMRGAWRSWKNVVIHPHGGLEGLLAPLPSSSPSIMSESVPPDQLQPPLHLEREDVIYLTADTDDVLDELQEGKTYVIGGIVDKNRYKSLCLNKSSALGVRRAKLPISEENLEEFERRLRAQGQTSRPATTAVSASAAAKGEGVKKGGYQGRKVLTVNQVADILLGWTETRDWVEAIGRGIPRRRFEGPSAAVPPACDKDQEAAGGDATSATAPPLLAAQATDSPSMSSPQKT